MVHDWLLGVYMTSLFQQEEVNFSLIAKLIAITSRETRKSVWVHYFPFPSISNYHLTADFFGGATLLICLLVKDYCVKCIFLFNKHELAVKTGAKTFKLVHWFST